MSEKMKASVLKGIRSINTQEIKRPKIKDNEVLIKVGRCGVCMTDHHLYDGTISTDFPNVPGHEAAGEIVQLGDNVTGVSLGTRVAINPSIPCKSRNDVITCKFCRAGRESLCDNMISTGEASTRDGAFAEYTATPVGRIEPIGDLPFRDAALAEPLSCCIHGVDQTNMTPGDTIVIIGAGPIGLLLLQEFQNRGAGKVIISEFIKRRRNIAGELGADETIDPNNVDPIEAIASLDETPDIVVDAVGAPTPIKQAYSMTPKGGTMLIFGVPSRETTMKIKPSDIFFDEINVTAARGNTNHSFYRASKQLQQGKIRVDKIVSDELSIEDLPKAFKQMEMGEGLKKQIVINN